MGGWGNGDVGGIAAGGAASDGGRAGAAGNAASGVNSSSSPVARGNRWAPPSVPDGVWLGVRCGALGSDSNGGWTGCDAGEVSTVAGGVTLSAAGGRAGVSVSPLRSKDCASGAAAPGGNSSKSSGRSIPAVCGGVRSPCYGWTRQNRCVTRCPVRATRTRHATSDPAHGSPCTPWYRRERQVGFAMRDMLRP